MQLWTISGWSCVNFIQYATQKIAHRRTTLNYFDRTDSLWSEDSSRDSPLFGDFFKYWLLNVAAMNCVTLLKICLLFPIIIISAVTQAQVASSRKTGQSRAGSSSSDGPFNPCRTASKVLPTSKKHIPKLAVTLLKTCGVRFMPLVSEKWGSLEKLLSFIPRFKYWACIILRMVYAASSSSNGRSTQLNTSQMYDMAYKILFIFLNDHSSSAKFCSRKKRRKGGKLFCYPKSQFLQALNISIPCLQEVVGDEVPEYAETAIHCMNLIIKKLHASGILHSLFPQ